MISLRQDKLHNNAEAKIQWDFDMKNDSVTEEKTEKTEKIQMGPAEYEVVFFPAEEESEFVAGVMKVDGGYRIVHLSPKPNVTLLSAICQFDGRSDLIGMAWALKRFNLIFAQCICENWEEVTKEIIMACEEGIESSVLDHILDVEQMAGTLKNYGTAYEELYTRIMKAVEDAKDKLRPVQSEQR
jgi:hypothetical protein